MFSMHHPIQFRGQRLKYQGLIEIATTESYVVHAYSVEDTKDKMVFIIELNPSMTDVAISEHHFESLIQYHSNPDNLLLVNFQCAKDANIYLPKAYHCYVVTQVNPVNIHGIYNSFSASEISFLDDKKRKTQLMIEDDIFRSKKVNLETLSASQPITPMEYGTEPAIPMIKPMSEVREITFTFTQDKDTALQPYKHKQDISDQEPLTDNTRPKKSKPYVRHTLDAEAELSYAVKGASASIETKTTMLDLYLKRGEFELAEALYVNMGNDATPVIKNIMLRHYAQQDNAEAVKRLYESIGNDATIYTKNILLHYYLKKNDIDATKQFFEKIITDKNGIKKKLMLRYYAQQGDVLSAQKFYMDNRGKDTGDKLKLIMLNLYINLNRYEDAVRVYKELNIRANLATKKSMLKLYLHHGDLELSKRLYSDICDTADIETKYAMMNLYEEHHEFRLANRIYTTVRTADIASKNMLLNLYVQHGNHEKALKLYTDISHEENIATKTIMFHFYAQQNNYKKAVEFYDQISTVAKIESKNTMLTLHVRHGKHEKAKQFYDSMNADANIDTQNAKLNLYIQQGKYEEAKQLYDTISATANIGTKNAMLNLYVRQRDYVSADKFYENLGNEANIVSKSIMLKRHVKQGNLKLAEQFYEVVGSATDNESKNGLVTLFADSILLDSKYALLNIYAKQRDHLSIKRLQTAEFLYSEIGSTANDATKKALLKIYAYQSYFLSTENIAVAEQLYTEISGTIDLASMNYMLLIYVNVGKFGKAEELYKAIGDRADITTKNIMLNFHVRRGKADQAELFYKNMGNSANMTSKNIMLNFYVLRRETEQAEQFYQKIGAEADIITKNTLLNLYVQEGSFEKAKQFYAKIGDEADIVTHNTILNLYASHGNYLSPELIHIAEKLYTDLGDKVNLVTKNIMMKLHSRTGKYTEAHAIYKEIGDEADLVTQNTMIHILCKQEKMHEAYALYESIPHKEKSLESYSSILLLFVRLITPERYKIMQNIADEYELKIKAENDDLYQWDHYGKLASMYHIFIGKVAYHKDQTPVELYRNKILKILTYLQKVIPLEELSMQHAWLFTIYFNDKEYSPKHTPLTSEQIDAIKVNAFKQLDHPLMPLKESKEIRIARVNSKGDLLSEYYLNDSIYNAIAPGIANYIIITFECPQKATRMPIFVKHKGKYYRTDVFGGTKLKAKIRENSYGSLIGIPIEAGEFFKTWLTSDESFWYGQRAFLPEDDEDASKGLQGRFRMALIPDTMNYAMMESFIVQDGCGYIKQSVAEMIGMKTPESSGSLQPANLTYQATQSYESYGQTAVVEEIITQSLPAVIPAMSSIKNKKVPNSAVLGNLCHALVFGIPNHVGLAIPVSGNKVIFGTDTPWKNYVSENDGIIIGRNPYDGKKLQVADVGFSPLLGKLRCMQYSLTGYMPSENATPVGRFFKGLLVVVPDDQWPKEFSSCDLMVSAKDEKLNQTWNSEQVKKSTQNSESSTVITLCGMLAIKQEYPRARVIGVPSNVAAVSAGDYDGDEYNVISTKNLPRFKELIIKGSSETIPNPKINKTFTPRTKIGNFVKILELRKPILERWVSIQNIIYSMSLSQRATFAAEITTDHALETILGKEWNKKLGLDTHTPTAMQIMIAEIQVGLKCGQDALKTKVPTAVLDERSRSYMRLFTKLKITVSVPYAKGFRSRFFISAAENFEALAAQLAEPLAANKSHNIVHKTQRGLVRFLTQQKADNGRIISDDEEESCTTSVTEMTVDEYANSHEQTTNKVSQEFTYLPSSSFFSMDAPTLMDLKKENELQHQSEHMSELELYPSISESYDNDPDFEGFWERALLKLKN